MNPEEKYEKFQRIGEGTYGVVFKAKDPTQKDIVALKKIKLEDGDQGVPSTTMREISILKQLQSHPNIVNLREVIYLPDRKKLHLIFDFVDYDMNKYIQKNEPLSNSQIKLLIYQLINGVHYCHCRRIMHRDLKPQNLLIDKAGNLKIADFGLAKTFSIPIKTYTSYIQTLWYRAPEIILGQKHYGLSVDVWAVGCIFAQLTERKPLFSGGTQIDQIFKIFQFLGTPITSEQNSIQTLPGFKSTFPKFKAVNPQIYFKNMDKIGLNLCMQMLALDPKRRISMKEALKHPYFNDLSEEEKSRYQ